MFGKQLRSYRLFNSQRGRVLIVPIDHTFSMGMVEGLSNVGSILEILQYSGCDAVVLHKGAIEKIMQRHGPQIFGDLKIITHLTGATSLSPTPARQSLLADVEDALALGADWVSVQVNFGCDGEDMMLMSLAEVMRQAYHLGVPVLVMAYVRDNAGHICMEPDKILHAARSVADLGVDAIKIPFVPPHVLRQAADAIPAAIVVGGGSKREEGPFLRDVHALISAGADGVCIGRNLFQSADPAAFTKRLVQIVRFPHMTPA